MHVDVALLDLGLPGIGGLAILSYLRQMGARTLVLSMNSDLISVRRALQSGAAGYISKNVEPGELITAIHAVAEGRQYIERRLAQDLALQPTDVRWGFPKLTAREREIMQLLAFGKSFYEIGVMLGVSYKTIANTAARLRSKLGAARTSDLIRLAIDTQNDR
jgi:DNA-binding NarL/FixJ family response regulator